MDPEFADNRLMCLYRTTDSGNKVARYRFEGDDRIVRIIPPAG